MGGSGGSGGSGTSTSTSGLAPFAYKYVLPYLQAAEGLVLGPDGQPRPSPLPNQQVAPFAPFQEAGFGGIGGETGPTSRDLSSALAQQSATASGQYLNPNNPYLNAYLKSQTSPIIEQYQTATAPSIAAQAAATGTLGGSNEAQNFQLANYDLATALGNVGASTYETERGLQQQAAQNMPAQAAGAYLPFEQLLAAGGQQQQQQQNVLNAQYQNAYQKAIFPYQELGFLGGALNPGLLGQTTYQSSSSGGGK